MARQESIMSFFNPGGSSAGNAEVEQGLSQLRARTASSRLKREIDAPVQAASTSKRRRTRANADRDALVQHAANLINGPSPNDVLDAHGALLESSSGLGYAALPSPTRTSSEALIEPNHAATPRRTGRTFASPAMTESSLRERDKVHPASLDYGLDEYGSDKKATEMQYVR